MNLHAKFQLPRLCLSCISMVEEEKKKKRRISSFRGYLSPTQIELSLSWSWAKADQSKYSESLFVLQISPQQKLRSLWKRDVKRWRDIIYELGTWLAQAVRQNSSHTFVWPLGPISGLAHKLCPSRNFAWHLSFMLWSITILCAEVLLAIRA